MSSIHVDVVSAEQSIFAGEAKFIALPGESGELGILPGHTPLITRIRPGAVRIEKVDGEEEFVFEIFALAEHFVEFFSRLPDAFGAVFEDSGQGVAVDFGQEFDGLADFFGCFIEECCGSDFGCFLCGGLHVLFF